MEHLLDTLRGKEAVTLLFVFVFPIFVALLKKTIDYITTKTTESSTRDIKNTLEAASNREELDISPDVLSKINIYLLKTKNRVNFELEDTQQRIRCLQLIDQASLIIDYAKTNKSVKVLNSAYELIKHADSLASRFNSDKIWAAGLLSVFLIGLIIVAGLTWNTWENVTKIIILGVPLPVLLWGAIGGVTAPLYRYLGFKGRYREDNFKTFLLRPFIGTLLGAVIYLVVKSGLIVFGNIPSNTQVANPELLYVFAFIGGFSESITGKLLHMIEGSLAEKEPTPNTTRSSPKNIKNQQHPNSNYRSRQKQTIQ